MWNSIIKTPKSELCIFNDFLSKDESIHLFNHVNTLLLDHNPQSKIYNKPVTFHRDIGFFSDTSHGYKYTNQITTAQPLTLELETLLKKVNTTLQVPFNGILINRYNSGNDYIGAHSDDEHELAPGGIVACISLGQSRIFRVHNKQTRQRTDINTKNGQLLLMKGSFQSEFTHGIPIQSKVIGTRISLTFRYHLK